MASQILQTKDMKKAKRNESISITATPPLTLFEGQRVLLQNPDTKLWDRRGIVQRIRGTSTNRRCYVESEGVIMLRSRRMLKADPSFSSGLVEVVNSTETVSKPSPCIRRSKSDTTKKVVSFMLTCAHVNDAGGRYQACDQFLVDTVSTQSCCCSCPESQHAFCFLPPLP